MNISAKKAAIVVFNYFEQAEFSEPLKVLKDAGAEVHVISASGERVLQGMQEDITKADTFQADALLQDVNLTDYDALVLPGGTINADNLRTVPAIQQAVQAFAESAKPLAVICHAPWVLISSGVARGKRLTSYPSLRVDLENAGAEWVDETVVIDGNLITSRNPDDLPAFCSAIVDALQQ